METKSNVNIAVVVAVNNEELFKANILSSPGLQEIGAQIIPVRGAKSAAEAFEQGIQETTCPWIIYCHQDVYFPENSGREIERLVSHTSKNTITGFAGLATDATGVGLVDDRGMILDWPETDKAISVDELAVVLHRDCEYKIDATLGWHLWATDLCLQAMADGQYAQVPRIMVRHNSPHNRELPPEFYVSKRLLADKYSQIQVIHTLCTTIRRALIAISSCEAYEQSGMNTPMRETWLPDCVRLGMDYKFFHGTGSTPKEDVVVVPSGDDYYTLIDKAKEKVKWAIEHKYDHVFMCTADTYAGERLTLCGYEKYSYFGGVCTHPDYGVYCQGGAGFFLNREACEVLSKDTDTPYVPTTGSEDTWVGMALKKAGILPTFSPDFIGFPSSRYDITDVQEGPRIGNNIVALHLSYIYSDLVYRPEDMYRIHREWKSGMKSVPKVVKRALRAVSPRRPPRPGR
jgi:hypothetical protein